MLLQARQAFSRLNAPVLLVNERGECLLPEGAEGVPVPETAFEGELSQAGGFVFLGVSGQRPMALCCREDVPGAKDVLVLAKAMLEILAAADAGITESDEVYRRVLREEISGSDLEILCHEHQLADTMERCVLLFHIVQTGEQSAFALLNEIVPRQDNDVLIEMDRHEVALLKDMDAVEGMDELCQFAEAVQETLMSETAHQVRVGIGQPRNALSKLGESYREARRAIEVGRIFQPAGSIYLFNRLMLERFLMELPRELSAYYHGLLFNRKTARLFNEEMLYTIEMFFQKDLNLSDTARQLYIHRNTLVYRLDKVQRQIGLDLRKFEDAVTFKILLELKKCGAEKLQQVH